jgi:hypothetical protein
MKLGIVIPLKSQRVSRDWGAVSRCLEATLRSLDKQSCSDWLAVVVGHEKPQIPWGELSDNITWISSEHDLCPIKHGGDFTKYADFDRILDKNRKTAIAMRHLREHAITDWFVLDADDLMHRDFVKTLSNQRHQAGWLIRNGFLWYQDIKRLMPCDNMLNLCGSTAIVSAGAFEVPMSGRDEDLRMIPWCHLSHSDMEAFLLPHLAGSDPTFPLPATAYTLSHGDNCSDEFRTSAKARFKLWVKKRILTRPVTRQFVEDFGLKG